MGALRYVLVYAVLIAISATAFSGIKGAINNVRVNQRVRVERNAN